MRRRTWLSICVVGLAGCTGSSGSGADGTDGGNGDGAGHQSDGTDDGGGAGADAVALELVADGESIPEGPSRPVAYQMPAGVGGLGYVADQLGTVHVVDDGGIQPGPLLDVRDRVVERESWEQGLLGIEPHPDFATTRKLYVRYSGQPPDDAQSPYSHTFVLSEFQVEDSYRSADPASERKILELRQPQPEHNGGAIVFGPDGYLYVGVGDGGSWGDVGAGHVEDWYDGTPGGNGQDITENLLGGILRIDVDTSEGNKPYGIPDDNPLVGTDELDEYFAWGLRNPYRMSFDSEGVLYAGDVGGSGYEEINIVVSGGNYGWNIREGPACQVMTLNESEGSYDQNYKQEDVCPETTPEGEALREPIVAYENTEEMAASVICGHVYENTTVPAMTDKLVFADFVPGGFGHLLAATPPDDGEGPWEAGPLPVADSSAFDTGGKFILDVARDHEGEIYLTTSSTQPRFEHGKVFKIVPP